MARPKKNKEVSLMSESPDPNIVCPSIQVEGSKNALQGMFEGSPENLPVLTSVGYSQVPGTNTYMAYTIHSRGAKIIKINVEEPNMKNIAEESAKIFFVTAFMDTQPNE